MAKTPQNTPPKPLKSRAASTDAAKHDQRDENDRPTGDSIALPSHVAGSGTFDRLVDTARDYARAATSANANKAYAADWKHFTGWCRRHGAEPLGGRWPSPACPDPQLIGLYPTEPAAPTNGVPALSFTTVDRRDDTIDRGGRIEFLEDGAVLRLRGKTGWREVEIGRCSCAHRVMPNARLKPGFPTIVSPG